MKNLIYSITILLFIQIMSCGCTIRDKDIVLRDFKKKIELRHTPTLIKSGDIGEIVDILILDSVLIANEMFNEKIFKFYNVKTGEIIHQACNRGKGPNEILYPNLMNKYNDSTFTMFDITKKELIYINILNFSKGNTNFVKKDRLNFSIFRANSVNDSLVLCTGVFEDGGYYLINKNIANNIVALDYPPYTQVEKLTNVTKGFILQGELALRPNHNEFVKVCNGAGVFEIGKIDNFELEYTFTKTYFFPDIKLVNNRVIHSPKDRYAFHSLLVTENVFYVVYSGKSLEKEGGEFSSGHNVLVYDWSGNPIANLQLDRDVKRMSLDEKNNTIYAYSVNPITGEPEIITYKLPLL